MFARNSDIDHEVTVLSVSRSYNPMTSREVDEFMSLCEKKIANGTVNGRTQLGISLLHVAVKHRCLKVVQRLVEGGADVNAIDKRKCSPLHFASFKGLVPRSTIDDTREIVKALIAGGANLEQQDDEGYTPLMRCFMHGYKKSTASTGAENLLGDMNRISALLDAGATLEHASGGFALCVLTIGKTELRGQLSKLMANPKPVLGLDLKPFYQSEDSKDMIRNRIRQSGCLSPSTLSSSTDIELQLLERVMEEEESSQIRRFKILRRAKRHKFNKLRSLENPFLLVELPNDRMPPLQSLLPPSLDVIEVPYPGCDAFVFGDHEKPYQVRSRDALNPVTCLVPKEEGWMVMKEDDDDLKMFRNGKLVVHAVSENEVVVRDAIFHRWIEQIKTATIIKAESSWFSVVDGLWLHVVTGNCRNCWGDEPRQEIPFFENLEMLHQTRLGVLEDIGLIDTLISFLVSNAKMPSRKRSSTVARLYNSDGVLARALISYSRCLYSNPDDLFVEYSLCGPVLEILQVDEDFQHDGHGALMLGAICSWIKQKAQWRILTIHSRGNVASDFFQSLGAAERDGILELNVESCLKFICASS